MKKLLFSALALLPIAFGSMPEAKAFDRCFNVGSGQVCAYYGPQEDFVRAYLPGYGTEDMRIICRNGGYGFESEGTWSRADVREFASNYCSSRGYAHN